MKKFILLAILLMAFATSANAYVIDGVLDDWGVTPGPYGSSDWMPNSGVRAFIEDSPPWVNYVGPGYGGQPYDIEALYGDFDNDYLYLAMVAGFGSTSYEGVPGERYIIAGDLAINFDDPGPGKNYKYGIETTGLESNRWYFAPANEQGGIYSNATWIGAHYFPISDPVNIGNGSTTYLGTLANFVYTSTPDANNHYILETKVPLSYFSSDWNPSKMYVHFTSWCGNDVADLPFLPVPEPSSLILLGTGLLGLVGYGKVRLSRKK